MGIRRHRPVRFRKRKRLYVIATEGAKTEPTYLRLFTPGRDGEFRLRLLGNPGHKSAPGEVVERLLDFEARTQPGQNTEYWALIDRDSWEESAISEANALVKGTPRFHLALSNPCFEFWLYLHFSDSRPFLGSDECRRALQKVWKDYRKSGFDPAPLVDGIPDAIRRARELAATAAESEPWPAMQGTHVYRLVEKLC